MWHIELVKNKYESLEDLYSLLQYVFRLNHQLYKHFGWPCGRRRFVGILGI